jgi:hypothetical protein
MQNSIESKKVISSASLMSLFVNKNIKGGRFTLKSIKTGKEFTYSISRSEFKGNWYTHVKVENNYLEFNRIGSYFNGRITNKRKLVDTPSAKAIAFVLKAVEDKKFDLLDNAMETYHLGSCVRCGKTLTDSVSINRGLGPICASK